MTLVMRASRTVRAVYVLDCHTVCCVFSRPNYATVLRLLPPCRL